MTEFDIYCSNKSPEDRERLSPVRELILSIAPNLSESRVHFYLVYHLGPIPVVKLDIGPKEQPRLSFTNGSELLDTGKLLKGKSLVRTLQITNQSYLDKNESLLRDLLTQSYEIVNSRWDGVSHMLERDRLRPDQPSP